MAQKSLMGVNVGKVHRHYWRERGPVLKNDFSYCSHFELKIPIIGENHTVGYCSYAITREHAKCLSYSE